MTIETCTTKPRRKEWGTLEDFLNYYCYLDHIISMSNATFDTTTVYHATIVPFESDVRWAKRALTASHEDKYEAFRLAVEKFISWNDKLSPSLKDNTIYLPWKPDYDLSTIEGCKQAIEESGWQICSRTSTRLVATRRDGGSITISNIEEKYEPQLIVWQSIAERAILNAVQAASA